MLWAGPPLTLRASRFYFNFLAYINLVLYSNFVVFATA